MVYTRSNDISGQKFGKLTVVKLAESRKTKSRTHARWVCKCDCGVTTVVFATNLKQKITRSCGCISGSDILPENRTERTKLKLWAQAVRKLHKHTCVNCGETKGLIAAHHIISKEIEATRYDISNGTVLCFSCHKIFHMSYPGVHTNAVIFVAWLKGE
jgi:hypothetical protein